MDGWMDRWPYPIFTQPAVAMVVTNIRYGYPPRESFRAWGFWTLPLGGGIAQSKRTMPVQAGNFRKGKQVPSMSASTQYYKRIRASLSPSASYTCHLIDLHSELRCNIIIGCHQNVCKLTFLQCWRESYSLRRNFWQNSSPWPSLYFPLFVHF